MTGVFLRILSVAGISLLAVAGVLLAAVLLVLFFPVSYRASGEKTAERAAFQFRASWLFGLVRFGYRYPDPGKAVVKILWFKVYESGKARKKDGQADRTGDGKKDGQADGPGDGKKDGQADGPGDGKTDGQAAKEKLRREEARGERNGGLKNIIEKIQYTIRSIYDKIKEIWQNISYYQGLLCDRETGQLFSHVMFRLGRIIKALRPKRLRAQILFGTGAPDTTGYIFGVYSMLASFLGDSVQVTPDFERAVLEGECKASGFTVLAVLLWHVLKAALDKRLKRFIDRLRRKKPENAGKDHLCQSSEGTDGKGR